MKFDKKECYCRVCESKYQWFEGHVSQRITVGKKQVAFYEFICNSCFAIEMQRVIDEYRGKGYTVEVC
jgi:hypothetical protein